MKVSLRVKPGSSQEKVILTDDGSLVVYCHARAHDGEANAAVVRLVAEYYGVAKSSVRIVRGAKNKDKILEI
ncbi:DUF167 domain-containing protein [Candidatus Saccharibacteria bacterium]|nr:DUF167 domain-containing protein [Candidatus Saccharibacteria bacterium]